MSRSYRKIELVPGLQCGANGPYVVTENEDVLVHMRQGDADGACGPYALMMALLLLGLTAPDKLTPLTSHDRRTRLGKFFRAMGEEDTGTLFQQGTDVGQLEAVVRKSYAKKIEPDRFLGQGAESRAFVLGSLRKGDPCIVGIGFEGGAHWLLVVGAEYEVTVDDTGKEQERPLSLLALDSSAPTTNAAPWNAWVGLIATRGKRRPYRYLNCGMREFWEVQLQEALALHLR